MPGARAPVPFEGPNTCRVLYYDQNYSLGSQNPTVTQNPTNCNYEGTCSPVTFRLPVSVELMWFPGFWVPLRVPLEGSIRAGGYLQVQ